MALWDGEPDVRYHTVEDVEAVLHASGVSIDEPNFQYDTCHFLRNVLPHTAIGVRDNEAFMNRIFAHYPQLLGHASERLRGDKDVVLRCIDRLAIAVRFSLPPASLDKDVATMAISYMPEYIKNLDPMWRFNEAFIIEHFFKAVRGGSGAWELGAHSAYGIGCFDWLEPKMQANRNILELVIDHEKFFPQKLSENIGPVLLARAMTKQGKRRIGWVPHHINRKLMPVYTNRNKLRPYIVNVVLCFIRLRDPSIGLPSIPWEMVEMIITFLPWIDEAIGWGSEPVEHWDAGHGLLSAARFYPHAPQDARPYVKTVRRIWFKEHCERKGIDPSTYESWSRY